MSFAPDPNDNVGRRVLPRVFADVPSAAEVNQAKVDLQAAKSTRNLLGLVVVLLLGMLIAAGAGLVYFEGQARVLEEDVAKLEKESKDAAEKSAAELALVTEQRDGLATELRSYQVIIETRATNDKLREDIRTVLEKKPGAAKVRKPTLGTDASRTAFEDPSWPLLRERAEQELAAETLELEKIKKEVTAWRPRVTGGFDPRQ